MVKIVECWMEHPVRSIDRTFTYLYEGKVEAGARVHVPFGNKVLIGFVESVQETTKAKEEIEKEKGFSLKYVQDVLDAQSLITDELHDLALWMKEQTLSTAISCFQAMLPAKIKPSSSHKNIIQEKMIKITDQETTLTPKQLDAFLYVRDHQPLTYTEFRKKYPNVARVLIEKKAVELYRKEKEAKEYRVDSRDVKKPLTGAQEKAIREIRESKDSVYLLKGVTGSGKTEIYLQLAEEVLNQGKQVLFLVPEIGLTPQMITRVSSRFGKDLAIYHSALNDQEKYEQYRMVMTGRARMVVGTRSSIFLPFENLGLIVMDEEHDTSYKQENQPAYHCRDVAIYRGQYHHCKVILGSATPTLDSYARALKKVYHLVTLEERINGNLPEVTIVSMQDAMRNGESAILSNRLKEEIEKRLIKKEQVILLLNRRGFHTELRCRSCGETLYCPHCDLALHYHRNLNRLKCHACGTETYVPKVCPTCGSIAGFTSFGYGTERLEEEVKKAFPEARILRMDADTTSRKNSHEKILSAFGRKEADILLGTQMIAKGLDFPDVTLVGVLNGDDGLTRTDFRSCEATFDLLMQAVGRAGRAEKKGQALIQAFQPDHYAVVSAAKQDYDSFFQREMQFRHAGSYPPYTFLISITIIGVKKDQVERTSFVLKDALHGDFKVLGVTQLLRISDRYRNRILLKGRNMDEMRNALKIALEEKGIDSSGVRIDMNPMTLD